MKWRGEGVDFMELLARTWKRIRKSVRNLRKRFRRKEKRRSPPRLVEKPDETVTIKHPLDAFNLLWPEMGTMEQECFRVLLLNTKNKVVADVLLYLGNVSTDLIRIGEIFREAVRHNAVAIVCAHNHPSGDPTPSPEDVQVSREIAKAGELLGIDVLDHLIIGRSKYVSLKERGLFEPPRKGDKEWRH